MAVDGAPAQLEGGSSAIPERVWRAFASCSSQAGDSADRGLLEVAAELTAHRREHPVCVVGYTAGAETLI
jgi:hypothetical protein